LFEVVGERQIEIVAAEDQVVADRDPMELGFAAFAAADSDEGEVGGAAADVANEDRFAGGDLLFPIAAVANQPRVEGGLRFFDQDNRRDKPASEAAAMVSSRATSSNDAGSVRTKSWASSGSRGSAQFQASRTCRR
jgi:hypothetical protein